MLLSVPEFNEYIVFQSNTYINDIAYSERSAKNESMTKKQQLDEIQHKLKRNSRDIEMYS